MPSPHDLDERIFRETSKVFGEQFRHIPMRQRPNGQPVADQDRPECCFTGQMSRPHNTEQMGSRRPAGGVSNVSTRQPSVMALLRDFTSEPRQGDLVERLATGTVYTLADVRPNGHGRAVLPLLQDAPAAQFP